MIKPSSGEERISSHNIRSCLAAKMDINTIINVIDKKDKKPYLCKIIATNMGDKKIKIHFIDWSDSHDEWIHMDSERIVEDGIYSDVDQSKVEPANFQDTECKEILGRLLMKSNEVQKKVISAFNHIETTEKNEKQLGKFQVPMLEDTAEYLKVRFEDSNRKKLYPKSMLVKKIVNKLYSILPSVCSECKATYSIDLNDKPLFLCHMCDRGVHNCEKMEEFHSALPNIIPKGFVWIIMDLPNMHR